MKLFNHYSILIEVTGDIRATVKTKLWRMGKLYSSYGGAKRKQQLLKWPSTSWKFEVSEVKVNHQLINRKRKLESQLEEENSKRRRLERELKNLKKSTKEQATVIARLKTGRLEKSKGSSLRPWNECSRQQQYNREKNIANGVKAALSFCSDKGFEPCSIEILNVDTGNHEMLQIKNAMFSHNKDNSVKSVGGELHSSLYIKDKFCISDEAFHETCMLPSLPKSGQVKRLAHKMNSKYEILNTPNGTIGVQQSLKSRIEIRMPYLADKYQREKRALTCSKCKELVTIVALVTKVVCIKSLLHTLLVTKVCIHVLQNKINLHIK